MLSECFIVRMTPELRALLEEHRARLYASRRRTEARVSLAEAARDLLSSALAGDLAVRRRVRRAVRQRRRAERKAQLGLWSEEGRKCA